MEEHHADKIVDRPEEILTLAKREKEKQKNAEADSQ